MPERLIHKKNNMMNYCLSKRRINSGMDPGIESDPTPSAVSGSITIGGRQEQKGIFSERSDTWHIVGARGNCRCWRSWRGHYRNLSLRAANVIAKGNYFMEREEGEGFD